MNIKMPRLISIFKVTLISIFMTLFFSGIVLAEAPLSREQIEDDANTEESQEIEQEVFRAVVLEVLDESSEGDNYYQDLQLIGKTGPYKNVEFEYLGKTENISASHNLKKGDVVFISASKVDDKDIFLIVDKSRLPSIYFLALLFVGIVLLVGKWHGARALLSLAFTFMVIIGFVMPRILDGAEPVTTVVLSSLVIVIISMLIVYGWTKKSKIAISGMLVGVVITALISKVFTDLAALTGSGADEVMFLRDYLGTGIDFRGLLLASFILGSLGILDDIAITQTSTAQEISEANKDLPPKEIYKKSMKVGVDHIASMINTLFLAYAGASFTLLLLFALNQPPFESLSDVINNQLVATEIIRTLVGSIGLILTVPITTYLASYFYGNHQKK
jgi:uncharacterized membrane protein